MSDMKLINTNELAHFLNVTTRTIGNLVKKKKIPLIKVGTLNRFDLQRVLDALEVEQQKEIR